MPHGGVLTAKNPGVPFDLITGYANLRRSPGPVAAPAAGWFCPVEHWEPHRLQPSLGARASRPQPQADLDQVSGIVKADEDATDEVLAELMAGPALEAVLNVEELYNLSLARGLKVGLAKVAIEEPPALVLERR